MTWNPVTGCYHKCEYCYARRIAERFRAKDIEVPKDSKLAYLGSPFVKDGKKEPYPCGFMPTFHRYRLDEPQKISRGQNIFVCSMADLFGSWVPDSWISEVFEACRKAPQHAYLFLTKNPSRYDDLIDKGIIRESDTNFWLGTTVTDLGKPSHWNRWHHTFWSCEPILAPWPDAKLTNRNNKPFFPEWVILGAETGNRRNKVVPQKSWVDNIVQTCEIMGSKILMKDSLVPVVGEENMIRQLPSGLWSSVDG